MSGSEAADMKFARTILCDIVKPAIYCILAQNRKKLTIKDINMEQYASAPAQYSDFTNCVLQEIMQEALRDASMNSATTIKIEERALAALHSHLEAIKNCQLSH